MRKNSLISFLVFIVILTASPRGEAFVPQTPHLLHLVVQKIKTPAGLVVYQTRQIAGPTDENVALTETLTYSLPGNLRSDTVSVSGRQFYVQSETGFAGVSGDRIAALEKPPAEHFTDPLLYRDHERMALALVSAGVDIENVTFQRLDGQICYLVGQPSSDLAEMPGLWIDKESFFPVRYLIRKDGRIVDVRYGNWQRVSRTWYPMETTISVDGEPFANILVNRFELASGFSPALFDVDKILARYPREERLQESRGGHGNRIDALDRDIEDFSKLYDQ
ncbi:MAG: hypothetical protein V6Z89_06570 [Desulfobacter sp.]